MKFVGLVGSNYDQSYNRKLLEFIRRYFKLKFEPKSFIPLSTRCNLQNP
ncbi:oxidoreductase, truncated [Streptococcus pneumoniae]|nr:oxidoreductase, truncated [Streptococcus pneumoniae]